MGTRREPTGVLSLAVASGVKLRLQISSPPRHAEIHGIRDEWWRPGIRQLNFRIFGMSRARAKSLASPVSRPLRFLRDVEVAARFEQALSASDGLAGAHCVHERWMRGEMAVHIERALERLWKHAAASVPDWLPTRHIDWLPLAYEAAAQFTAKKRGRSNVYLVLLDYSDSRADPYGIYVGMSRYTPSERFDQHKAGIRAAGSVLHRGLEVLTGPTLHLANISRDDAARIEEQLAEALTIRGLFVQGGH